MNNSIAQVCKKSHFSKQDGHSDDFGLRSPVIQKTFERKCATFILERVADVPSLRAVSRLVRTCSKGSRAARRSCRRVGSSWATVSPRRISVLYRRLFASTRSMPRSSSAPTSEDKRAFTYYLQVIYISSTDHLQIITTHYDLDTSGQIDT